MKFSLSSPARLIGLLPLFFLFQTSCRENTPGETVPPAAAQIVMCTGDTLDFGETITGAVIDVPLTISNTGVGAVLAFNGIAMLPPFTFKDGIFPGTGGDCTSQLPAGESCTVVLRFTPTDVTNYSQAVTIAYTSFAGTDTTTCTFTGAGLRNSGGLDTSFHTDGVFTVALPQGDNNIYGATTQSDGKTVLVGSAFSGMVTAHLAVVRLTTNGALDTSFHTNGYVLTSDGRAMGVLQETNGALLVAAYAEVGDWQLLRYSSNGNLETSFATTGMATLTFDAGVELATDLFQQTDGKIIMGGTVAISGQYMPGFARFHTNGELDTDFGSEGRASLSLGQDAELVGLARQADGGFVGAASTTDLFGNMHFAVLRYQENGQLDLSFATQGILLSSDFISVLPGGIAVQTDGQLLVGGSWGDSNGFYHFFLARYSSDGNFDTSFATTGFGDSIQTGIVQVDGVALQTNGQIVMGAQIEDNGVFDFGLVRWRTDGTLDSSFGTAGVARATLAAGDNVNGTLLVQDDKLLRVGRHTVGTDGQVGVARFVP